MTLAEALAITAGETIRSAGLPNLGVPAMSFRITSVQPARPEFGYAPSISGYAVNPETGELARHHSFWVALDGGRRCMAALSYWTRAAA